MIREVFATKDWEYGRMTDWQGIWLERIERIAAALEASVDEQRKTNAISERMAKIMENE